MAVNSEAKSSRIGLIIIMLLPIIMIGGATFVYYTGIGMPEGTTNNGDLIEPPRSIEDIKLQAKDGSEYRYNEHIHKWSLIIPALEECNTACLQTLYFTRQVHVALGKEANGLRRF